MKLVRGLGVTAAVIMAGCSADYVSNSTAPVLLVISSINGGNIKQSDVRLGTGICPDSVPVVVRNLLKNQSATAPTSSVMGVQLQKYEVHYTRSDGRSTQGVDIPFNISGALSAEVDVNATATVNIEVVRDQAKLEPPLTQLATANSGGGQALIVSMFANITVYGQTIAGQGVSAAGAVQIDFSDFADSATTGTATCPTT